ncbi:hypothetical protein NA78x_005501 [Anatilimnocola sp. NA78]|uniref:hypothetical protein n=1 Tax=Anatilimnocola sp. NA78 TaxID=3415683 RepID=UPI003CE493AF
MAKETTPVKPGPKLLERMRDKLRAKHLALSTERAGGMGSTLPVIVSNAVSDNITAAVCLRAILNQGLSNNGD